MQFARDDFVVKYSIQSNLSPERIQQRLEERSADKKMFQPLLLPNKSKQIIEKDAAKTRSLYLRMQKSPNSETKAREQGSNWSFSSMVDYGKVTRDIHRRTLEESKEREK
jgi:hypothetical protein